MSFETHTDEMTSEPSLMDIFGPDASEEVITRDKEAAMLSMADIAAVMNAEDDSTVSAVWPDLDYSLMVNPTHAKPLKIWHPEELVARPSRETVDALRKKYSRMTRDTIVTTFDESGLRIVKIGNRSGLLLANKDVDSHLERLGEQLQTLLEQDVDLSDITLSLSYINPQTHRVETKVLEHEDPSSYPSIIGGSIRGHATRNPRTSKIKK